MCTRARSSVVANGFVTKSYAPRFIASIAVSTVECAVITMTSVSSLRARAMLRRSSPEPSGIIRSVSTTPYGEVAFRIASRAVANLVPKSFAPQKVVLVGVGEGGHAVLAAHALASGYGLSGKLVGVAAFAPIWTAARSFGALLSFFRARERRLRR